MRWSAGLSRRDYSLSQWPPQNIKSAKSRFSGWRRELQRTLVATSHEGNLLNDSFTDSNIKGMDKQSILVSLSSELMQQLHNEFRKRVLYERLEYTPEEAALDRICAFAQVDPVRFHESWIRPLLCEGVSIEAAFAHIMDSCFQPN